MYFRKQIMYLRKDLVHFRQLFSAIFVQNFVYSRKNLCVIFGNVIFISKTIGVLSKKDFLYITKHLM